MEVVKKDLTQYVDVELLDAPCAGTPQAVHHLPTVSPPAGRESDTKIPKESPQLADDFSVPLGHGQRRRCPKGCGFVGTPLAGTKRLWCERVVWGFCGPPLTPVQAPTV